jgi:UDP:flavonoid glycosyltransferase YjiC (YdhE family)
LAAARSLAASGVPTAFVGPAAGPAEPNLRLLGTVPQPELAELMSCARLIVANGGSTLLQAIACGSACVAVPIARDQSERTRRCVLAGAAVGAALDAAAIAQTARDLLHNEAARGALGRRAAELRLADGVEVAVQALDRLLAP